ncbi:MAG: COG1361 S-layer family protein [Candidatus Woesearchaeota archaeon]
MKKILLILICVLSTLIFASFVSAVMPATSPQISVTLVSQSPDPVEPGEVVILKFKIENSGTQSSEDAIVRVRETYPFSAYDGITEKNIGKLKASTTGANAQIVEFKLKVDPNAVEKDTEVELEVQIGSGITTFTNNEFMVDIQTRDAILEITSITYEPEQVPAGRTADIRISVKNLADSLLKDVTFDLDFSGDIPLAPYQSTSRRQINSLSPNHQLPLSFKVIAEPDALPGLYKVPLNISYNDAQGNSYRFSEVLAISVGEEPKLNAYVKKSEVMQNKKSGKVTLEVANTGSTDIKFFELTILDSEQFDLVSTTNYFYIGDIDSDDTESEEIEVYVNTKEDVVIIPVLMKYSDANNQEYTEEMELNLNLYSTSQLKKFGVIQSNNNTLWILLVLLVVVFFVLRKKKPQWLPRFLRKKEKKK